MLNQILCGLIHTNVQGMRRRIILSSLYTVNKVFIKKKVYCKFTKCAQLWMRICNELVEKS